MATNFSTMKLVTTHAKGTHVAGEKICDLSILKYKLKWFSSENIFCLHFLNVHV